MAASDPIFGLRLKEIRKAAGITQLQLAQKSELALSTIAALEQGQYDATWPTVKAIAAALGVTCEAFTKAAEECGDQSPGRPTKLASGATPPAKSKKPKK